MSDRLDDSIVFDAHPPGPQSSAVGDTRRVKALLAAAEGIQTVDLEHAAREPNAYRRLRSLSASAFAEAMCRGLFLGDRS